MAGKPTIAIVNNDRNILRSLQMFLEAEQFEVRTYSNTADALDLLEIPADLALIDKTNPPLGGLELFRRIRTRHSMPVIFLSAWAEEIAEELCGTELEADDYITTPFSQRHVIERIGKVLARCRAKERITLAIDPARQLEP
jgi:two-component system response regulator ChvI